MPNYKTVFFICKVRIETLHGFNISSMFSFFIIRRSKITVKSVEIYIQNQIEQFIPDLSVKINLFLFYFQIWPRCGYIKWLNLTKPV